MYRSYEETIHTPQMVVQAKLRFGLSDKGATLIDAWGVGSLLLASAQIHNMGQEMEDEAIGYMHELAEYVAGLESVVADTREET